MEGGAYENIRQSYDSIEQLEIESDGYEDNMHNHYRLLNMCNINRLVLLGTITFVSFLVYVGTARSGGDKYSNNIVRFADMDVQYHKLLFENFVTQHGKTYSSEEKPYRFEIFTQNLLSADEYNDVERKNGGTALHGITKFSDVSPEEFAQTRLGADINLAISKSKPISKTTDNFGYNLPPETHSAMSVMDWTGSLTTPIKDQGDCGGCWAFTAVEQIESDALRLKLPGMSPHTPLSSQQLLSCCRSTNETGCNGGWFDGAYKYVCNSGGLVTDQQYPYANWWGGDVAVCISNDTIKANAKISLQIDNSTGLFEIGFDYEKDIANHVLSHGPVNTVMDASSFRTYKSGIVSSCSDKFKINHAVQIVGVNLPEKYWIVRNSWGTDWGMGGYVHVQYGTNMCGIAEYAHYVTPKLADPEEDSGEG